jgi:glycosidase
MKKKTPFMQIKEVSALLVSMVLVFMWSCQTETKDETNNKDDIPVVQHPEWSVNAVLYELNVRQYSEDGSFKSVENDVSRLKELGVDIVWLMPVHPIGELNRKGELGSDYSVKDYRAVNPEFGTMDDFKSMVKAFHEEDIRLIIDWVPNHSAWDNPLAEEHTDWYVKDEEGNFVSPFDWTDVIQFDYNNRELRGYMIESLKFWIKETGIDGYRFDVAHMVPVDFWNEVREELLQVKEVFLLAEADQPFLHEEAMNMSYDWKLHHIMNEVAAGEQSAVDIVKHFAYVDSAYPPNSILMQFTSNHDENSWNGTVYDRLGEGVKTFAALSYTIPGMPLIYNGQEACMDKMLEFFVRDPIEWKDCEMFEFYQSLNTLREKNTALWSGLNGGDFTILDNGSPDVLTFHREGTNHQLFAVFNLSGENQGINTESVFPDGDFKSWPGDASVQKEDLPTVLQAWEYRIYTADK